MKFKQFLSEGTSDEYRHSSAPKANNVRSTRGPTAVARGHRGAGTSLGNISNFKDILENIKKECHDYLIDSGGYPLYRGQKFRSDTCKYETLPYRRNKDSKRENVGLFNLYIQQKFNIKNFRNEHIMFASARQMPDSYGPIMFVFPCNGYEFLWSPLVQDFLGREHSIRGKILNTLRNDYKFDLNDANFIMDKVDSAIKTNWPPNIKNMILDPKTRMEDGKNAYVILRKALVDVYDDLDYQMKYLKSAIESENEIMFRTKFYYGLDPHNVIEFLQMDKKSRDEDVYEQLYYYLRK